MDNLWPVIEDVKTTDDVIPFFELTIEELNKHYEGKIKAQICQIEYILKTMRSTLSIISDISTLVGKQMEKDKYEEKQDIEKDRKQAFVINRDYKYEIFNDHLYYKLFAVNITEYYPIKIHISAGILEKDDVEIDINNLDELKTIFSRIVYSDKVKMIIKKMMI